MAVKDNLISKGSSLTSLVETDNIAHLPVATQSKVNAGNFVRSVEEYKYKSELKRYNILSSLSGKDDSAFSDTTRAMDETETTKRILVLTNTTKTQYGSVIYNLKAIILNYNIASESVTYVGSALVPSSMVDTNARTIIRISNLVTATSGRVVAAISFGRSGYNGIDTAVIAIGFDGSNPTFSCAEMNLESTSRNNTGNTIPLPMVVQKLADNYFVIYDTLNNSSELVQVSGTQALPSIGFVNKSTTVYIPHDSSKRIIDVKYRPYPNNVNKFYVIAKLVDVERTKASSYVGDEYDKLTSMICTLTFETENSLTGASLSISDTVPYVIKESVGNMNSFDITSTGNYVVMASAYVQNKKKVILEKVRSSNMSCVSIVLTESVDVTQVRLCTSNKENSFTLFLTLSDGSTVVYLLTYKNYSMTILYATRYVIDSDKSIDKQVPVNVSSDTGIDKYLMFGVSSSDVLIANYLYYNKTIEKIICVDIANYDRLEKKEMINTTFPSLEDKRYYLEHPDLEGIYMGSTGRCKLHTTQGSMSMKPIVVQSSKYDPIYVLVFSSDEGLVVYKYNKSEYDELSDELTMQAKWLVANLTSPNDIFVDMINVENKLVIAYGYKTSTTITFLVVDKSTGSYTEQTVTNINSKKGTHYLYKISSSNVLFIGSDYLTLASIGNDGSITASSMKISGLGSDTTVLDVKIVGSGWYSRPSCISILYTGSDGSTYEKMIGFNETLTGQTFFNNVSVSDGYCVFYKNMSYGLIVPINYIDHDTHATVAMHMVIGSSSDKTSLYSVIYNDKELIVGGTTPKSCPYVMTSDNRCSNTSYMLTSGSDTEYKEYLLFLGVASSVGTMQSITAIPFVVFSKDTIVWGESESYIHPISTSTQGSFMAGITDAGFMYCFQVSIGSRLYYYTWIGELHKDGVPSTVSENGLIEARSSSIEITESKTVIQENPIGVALEKGESGAIVKVATNGALNTDSLLQE